MADKERRVSMPVELPAGEKDKEKDIYKLSVECYGQPLPQDLTREAFIAGAEYALSDDWPRWSVESMADNYLESLNTPKKEVTLVYE